MSKRTRTAAEKAWLGVIAALGCVLCRIQGRGYVEAEIHHIRAGQGMQERASDYLAIPLCPGCHRHDKGAVHGDKGLLKLSKVDELDFLALTVADASAVLMRGL